MKRASHSIRLRNLLGICVCAWSLALGSCSLPVRQATSRDSDNPRLNEEEISRLLDAARIAYDKKDFDAARLAVGGAIEIEPDHAGAHYDLARIEDESGNTREAYESIRRSLDLEPEAGSAWRLLGYLHLNQGRWTESAEASQRAIELAGSGREIAAQVNLGYALYRLGQSDRAYFHYQKALAIAPYHKQALIYSGLLLVDMRRITEARLRFESAALQHPDDAEAHYRLGTFLATEMLPAPPDSARRNVNKPEATRLRIIAIQHLERSITLQSDSPQAYQMLAYLHLHAREYDQAIRQSKAALAIDPRDDATRYNLGLAYYHNKDYGLARKQFEQILDSYPETENAVLFFANACLHLGQFETARQSYERAIQLNPDNAVAHLNLSKIHTMRGESELAREHLRRACLSGAKDACE